MNKVIFFYLVSIFMLANGSLFTWLFQGTPLNIWRQLIWILGLIIFFKYIRSLESIKLKKVVNVHLYIFIFIVFQALLTFAIYNFNFIRLLYAFWIYFSGLPFLLLPFLWREKLFSAQKFYDIFVCLGIFLTIGLIFDYLSGGFFTRMFLISVSSSLKDMLNDGRYCFLSEAPTTFGVYYCFCLFCTLYRLYICNDTKSKLMYLVIILSYIIGSWLTGSRQIVFALVLTFFVSVFYYIFCVRDKKSYLVVGILLLLFAIPYVKSFLYSEESYQNRYSVELLKKDTRYEAWEKGFRENIVENVYIFFVGKAVALSQGQKAHNNELLGSHYENTYFARLSEIGIIGVVLLLLPFIYLLKNWGNTSFFSVSLLAFFLSYVFISYISPNGSHQTTQMTIYLAFGLILNREYFDVAQL